MGTIQHVMASRVITRTVWILSLVSLFTDVASEMLYPVLPVYLDSIQFSVVLIGVLEGLAEAVAGLSKGYFGRLSDNSGKRLPFVRWGYLLSALSKPLMAAFVYPLWVFLVRTLDRLGKGIRTGARDAMLSDEALNAHKGRIFGFHRAMDTLGAVTGPALALLFLYHHPGAYRTLFVAAFVPGILAIGLTFLLKERPAARPDVSKKPSLLTAFRYLGEGPRPYRQLVGGLLFFALINSSDLFLLLRIKEVTGSDQLTIGSYIFYNLIYALCSYPMGILADRLGARRVFVAGLAVFSLVYLVMALGSSPGHFISALVLYGLYAAATEGVARAWISLLVPAGETATAIGSYAGLQSVCTLLASSLTGFVWWQFGAWAALLLSAAGALLVCLYLLFFVKPVGSAARR